MMVGVFAGNLTMQTRFQLNNFQVILFTSFLFGMVHYPNLILMLCTFAMQLLFTSVYLRWRNLWALGVMHGLIGTLLMFCMLQRDPWEELFVWF
jgi:membrane protease YdiL (CAAX protease family)